MLPNIFEHSELVARVALFLGRALNENGSVLNLKLVQAGALLHDITKTRSIQTRERHDATGEQLLREMGYPEVAYIVGLHVHLADEPLKTAFVTEAELVYYSDKRVKHSLLVSLEERYRDLLERYAHTPAHIRLLSSNHTVSREVERRVFTGLDLNPEDLKERLYETP
ncbi:MAG: HDIG domain-containing protein [Deltaproteobacteria bacterium]|nr:HDIG domain-containing protein [Deltaproteobacteria bacterium]